MIKEFKKFVFKGNVMDLAVGVVIGSAFTAIVTSLVNNVIMPFVGVLTAGVNFKDIKIDLSPLAKALGNKIDKNAIPTLSIGLFINSIVQFFIVAITVFIFIKIINVSREKMEELANKKGKKEKVVKPEDIKLLEEIRDLLKEEKKSKKK